MERCWINDSNLIAFPFDWQRPAKTEEWTWDYLSKGAHQSKFIEFVAFPWATLIDLIDRKQELRCHELLLEIDKIPPKKKLIRFTICQHIKLKKIIEIYKKIKITDVFWPHKTIGEDEIDGIRIHPYVLYPYAFFQKLNQDYKKIYQSEYLVSFVGAYEKDGYLSDARERIFQYRNIDRFMIIRRENWHFENEVYQNQIDKKSLTTSDKEIQQLRFIEYVDSLTKTAFSLCPSGAGPNTIRYWETIALGRIPVLISDSWDGPLIDEVNSGLNILEESLEEFLINIRKLGEENKVYQHYEALILNCEKNKDVHPKKWLDKIFSDFYKIQTVRKLLE